MGYSAAEYVGRPVAELPSRSLGFFLITRERGLRPSRLPLPTVRNWFATIDFTDAAATAKRGAQAFDGWSPELTALITDSDIAPVLRVIVTARAGKIVCSDISSLQIADDPEPIRIVTDILVVAEARR